MAECTLADKTIVITRSAERSEEWIAALTKQGATVYNVPTITMSPVPISHDIKRILQDLAQVDWLIFTSATGVRHFIDAAQVLDIDVGSVNTPVAVVGAKTAEAARAAGLDVRFVPSIANADTLGREIEPVEGKRLVLLRTTIASEELPAQLTKRGAIVTDCKIYTTVPRTDPDPELSKLLAKDAVSAILYASPSAVEGLCTRISDADRARAQTIPAVAAGETTRDALTKAGFTIVLTAAKPNITSIIDVMRAHMR